MKIKILQLNILKGRYIDEIVSFVNKNNFDILCLQEVANGKHSFKNVDCFNVLKQNLIISGIIHHDITIPNDSQSSLGNAIFYSNKITILNKKAILFDKYPSQIKIEDVQWDKTPKSIIGLTYKTNNRIFEIITTHLAWSDKPIDTEDKIIQGNQLIDYIKGLNTPFILTGDFNVDQKSCVIQKLNHLARNLTLEHNITNTLNPRTHRIKELFPPGLACDFIFTSKSLPVIDFKLIDSLDLSDHYGLMVEVNV
jgi:endonuclease/exonuclease/phosphatase family metal-dependent hydrolase